MGSGFSMDGINVIRANRSLLKKRKLKDIRQLLLEESGKTEVEFKEVSSIELAKIKAKIRKEAHQKVQREIAIYGIIALLLLLFFIVLPIYLLYFW